MFAPRTGGGPTSARGRLQRAGICVGLALVALVVEGADAQQKRVKPDVFYMPTPQGVVEAMLKIADVTSEDVVYDLGSGDGRIPITAARLHGARGIGIDIDPELVAEARRNAREAGVADKVTFRNEDLFTADISEATVVTLFLTPSLNISLLAKLNRELRPGTRIVSHRWEMKDLTGYEYQPKTKVLVEGSNVYLWTTPIVKGP
jgi:SAM-dependent methyltransferase